MKKPLNVNFTSFIRNHLLILLILLLGLTLRSYRLPEMASYDFDQEYATTFVLQVVKEYPIRYVGQGMSVQGLFMGPFYFYYLVPFYLAFGLNPLGGTIASVILGLVIIGLYYVVGKSLFSTNAGLLAALIRAISFYAIQEDWSMVPSYSSDLFVLATWWLLYQLWSGKTQYTPALFFIFGMFTSFHPIQFPFILIFLVLAITWKLRFSLKEWLLSIVAFILPVSPLLLFEYWRNWSMVKVILAASNGSGNSKDSLLEKLTDTADTMLDHWSVLWSIPESWSVISVLLAVGTVWSLRKHLSIQTSKKTSFHLSALIVMSAVFLLYYSLLPFHVPEYYLRGVQTIYLLYIGVVLAELTTKKWGMILVAAVFLLIIWKNGSDLYKKWQQTDLTTLAYKQQIIAHIIEKADGQPFQVSYITKPGWNSGFETLFTVAGTLPGAEGPVYSIIVPKIELTNDSYDYTSGGIGVTYPDQ